MRLIDTKFRHHKGRFLFQCTLAGLAMFLILALMTSYSNAAVMAALGSSCFLVFALPHQPTSQPRLLIGGYVVGILVGTLCFWLHRLVPLPEQVGLITPFPHILFGAIAVALSIFVMVVTNTEHPPAAGLALGFVILDQWRWITPLSVLTGILALCLVKTLLRPTLKDLL
jgi:CBS-domain-containing membrane protein